MSEPTNSNDLPIDAALASLEAGFLVGNGRFTLIRLIGRGGMGVVWRARDESMREDVALKFLPPEIRFDAVALDDLRRETARARKLTHPNIIRIHDLCRDDREAFISMEFIDGANLSDLRLEQPERVFTWKYLEPLVKQLCEALDYAHGEKVVHRDLKPANMLLDSRGRLKLSDFGIAAQVSDSVSRVSMIRHGQSGTITHMSPQQMDGKLPQVTDDIYALGATLYELLTSRPPFYSGDIAHQVRNLPPQPLKERLAELGIANDMPAPVVAIIMACLAKSPEQRPQSARAVAEWIGMPAAPAPTPTPTPMATRPPAREEPEARVASARVEDDFEADVSTDEIMETPRPVEVSPAISLREKARVILPPRLESEFAEEEKPAAAFHAAPISPRPASPSRAGVPLVIAALAVVILATLGMGAFVWWKLRQARLDGPVAKSVPNPGAKGETPKAVDGKSVVLFNGTDLSGWSGDPTVWSVREGVIRGEAGRRGNGTSLFWKEAIKDFDLRFSFRLSRGNSGLYYRSRQLADYEAVGYQFDIVAGLTGNLIEIGVDRARRDLFRVNAAALRRAGQPNPTDGGWHEAAITAQGRRLVQTLDGHVLCDLNDSETLARGEGLIALEAGSQTVVEFKDITLRHGEARVDILTTGSWKTLFNGTSLDAWRGWKGASWIGAWSIINQELHSLPGGNINLATREQYGDFELELEWKIAPGANSGVLYRALPSVAEVWRTAPEYQIVDDRTHRDGKNPVTATGSIYGVVPSSNKTLRPPGEFNSSRIIMRGSHTEHWLNGVKLLEADLASPEVQRAAFQKFSRAAWGGPARGHIVLQHLGGEASFRNIRVRRLDEP